MTPYYVTDIPGSPPERTGLMVRKGEDVLINMGGVIENFICSYMAVRGRTPETLVLSPDDTDELLAYMYISSQCKRRLIPDMIQGVKVTIDGERTCLI